MGRRRHWHHHGGFCRPRAKVVATAEGLPIEDPICIPDPPSNSNSDSDNSTRTPEEPGILQQPGRDRRGTGRQAMIVGQAQH